LGLATSRQPGPKKVGRHQPRAVEHPSADSTPPCSVLFGRARPRRRARLQKSSHRPNNTHGQAPPAHERETLFCSCSAALLLLLLSAHPPEFRHRRGRSRLRSGIVIDLLHLLVVRNPNLLVPILVRLPCPFSTRRVRDSRPGCFFLCRLLSLLLKSDDAGGGRRDCTPSPDGAE
jgi:hypothetical protein